MASRVTGPCPCRPSLGFVALRATCSGLVGGPKCYCSQHHPEAQVRRSGVWAWEPSVWSVVGQSRPWQPARGLLHLRLWILSGTFPSEYKADAGPFPEFWNLPGLFQVIRVHLWPHKVSEKAVGGCFLVWGVLGAAETHGWQALPLVHAGPGEGLWLPLPGSGHTLSSARSNGHLRCPRRGWGLVASPGGGRLRGHQ